METILFIVDSNRSNDNLFFVLEKIPAHVGKEWDRMTSLFLGKAMEQLKETRV